MNQSANVRSVDALQDFKLAMITFSEDAKNALTGVEMEVRRIRDWLVREQLAYWQTQVKRRNEAVSMARTELHRRRLSQQNSDAISDTEQKENLRTAQRRLEEAEDKVVRVKKWIPVLEHAIAEYHSAAQPLGDRLSGQYLNSMAALERTIAALDAYLTYAPPSAPVLPPESAGTAPAASGLARQPTATASGESAEPATSEPEPEPETGSESETTEPETETTGAATP
jgi:hypothetical protein